MERAEIESLLRGDVDAAAALARLETASRQLELPVAIDRKLHELSSSGLGPSAVLAALGAFLAEGEPGSA